MATTTAEKFPSSNGQLNTDWTSPTNVYSSDNIHAVASHTEEHDFYNFGFTDGDIPVGAAIEGIRIRIEAKLQTGGETYGMHLQLVKNGVRVGTLFTEMNSGIEWTLTSDRKRSRGGGSELWGKTWWDDDIKNANFGVWLMANQTSGSNALQIDAVGMYVTYTDGGFAKRATSALALVASTVNIKGYVRIATSTLSLVTTPLRAIARIATSVLSLVSRSRNIPWEIPKADTSGGTEKKQSSASPTEKTQALVFDGTLTFNGAASYDGAYNKTEKTIL